MHNNRIHSDSKKLRSFRGLLLAAGDAGRYAKGMICMSIQERWVHLSFQLDTNRINARAKLPGMNKLEQWENDGVIQLLMSDVALSEVGQGAGGALRSEKARNYVFTETIGCTPNEKEMVQNIGHILFPDGAKKQSDDNDILIVFHAWKNDYILLTDEGASKRQPGGMLGNREQLKSLGIQVMSDMEAVSLVEDAIKKRVALAIRRSQYFGEVAPDWIGKD